MKNKVKFNLQYPSKERSLILAICRCGGKTIKRSLNVTIPTEAWDKLSQRCKISADDTVRVTREYKKINRRLDGIEQSWNTLADKNRLDSFDPQCVESMFDSHLSVSAKKADEEDRRENRTPLQFFQEHIDKKTSMICEATGRNISEKTKGHHIVVLNRLKAYMRDTNTPDNFAIFDKEFQNKFTNWAYHTARRKQGGYSHNTVVATFSVLKIWLNGATEAGLITTKDYRKYPRKGEDVDNIALTVDEIEAIYRLNIPKLISEGVIDTKSTIEATRDLFIVGCWTGLRRADIARINEALFDLANNRLTIQTQKTNEKVIIPLHPFVCELYAKYHGRFPKLIDKSKANGQLQELGRLAKIDELTSRSSVRGGKIVTEHLMKYQRIGFHTGRRSFATNLYLQGAPTISIMKMTGHKTEQSFLKYIKVSKVEHSELMQKFFK
ncbi:site-specific integrase [Duncaniella freteri]|uniref:site-specific integrase n=2 Tax=Duncaniella TaxID=2518495 RepID=UPI002572CA90|nr:site-specific integrase [Duncaniella freteri]